MKFFATIFWIQLNNVPKFYILLKTKSLLIQIRIMDDDTSKHILFWLHNIIIHPCMHIIKLILKLKLSIRVHFIYVYEWYKES